jgi:hypothetical protein
MGNYPTHSEDAGQNTYSIAEQFDNNSSSWNEVNVAGKTTIEASSTTFARNSRFVLFVDNDFKTPAEFDNLVTKVGPLYQMTVQPGETYTIQGKERNEYSPGVDYTSAFASQFSESGAGDNIVPEGVKVVQGLGDFLEGTITDSAVQDAGEKEGFPLIFEPDDATFGVYRNSNLVQSKSLNNGEWIKNPFELDQYQYDVTRFAVKREEGNLYGSGSQRLFMKLRDIETGEEEYLKVAEVGDPSEAIVNRYNLFNTIQVSVDATGDPYTFSIGPVHYFVEGDINIPIRRKNSPLRNVPVNATFGDTAGTVFAVYRKDPNNKEVPLDLRCGGKAQTNGRIELREVHPNYIDFGTIDPTNDANWGPPPELRQRETAVQALDFTVGDVSLATDSNRMRGEQGSAVEYSGQSTSGGSSDAAVAGESERLSEFDYTVAVAKHQSTSEDIIRYELITQEFW